MFYFPYIAFDFYQDFNCVYEYEDKQNNKKWYSTGLPTYINNILGYSVLL